MTVRMRTPECARFENESGLVPLCLLVASVDPTA